MSGDHPVSYGRKVVAGSQRSFGLVFSSVFALIGIIPWILGHGLRPWALIVAALFLAAANFAPCLLAPLNWLWFKFGLLLHHIVNPIIMSLIFFGAVIPTALVMRVLRKDLLRLKREENASSYWIEREPPGPTPESMTRQF